MTGLFWKRGNAQLLFLLYVLFALIRPSVELASHAHSHCAHTINSVQGACSLKLSNFTMVGAHSAGAGAYGHLEYIPGVLQAPDCKTRNQDRSLTNLLQLGVRYFELKVCQRHPVLIKDTRITQAWLRWPWRSRRAAVQRLKSEESITKRDAILPLATEDMFLEGNVNKKARRNSLNLEKRQTLSVSEDALIHTANEDILSFQEEKDTKRNKLKKRAALSSSKVTAADMKRLFLYHNGAYTKPLTKALAEIDQWLGTHKNEIVVLRVSNTDDRHDISHQLSKEISVISHTGINEDRNPELGTAVKTNKRIVLFLKQEHAIPRLRFRDIRVHPIVKLDTTVKLHKNCAETTTLYAKKYRERENHHIIQIDWFHTLGRECNRELAQICNSREINRLAQINDIVLRDYHHPVNVFLVDFVEEGDNGGKLKHVVQKINMKNVLLYA